MVYRLARIRTCSSKFNQANGFLRTSFVAKAKSETQMTQDLNAEHAGLARFLGMLHIDDMANFP